MKKTIFCLVFLVSFFAVKADFGPWASAVFLSKNGTDSYYNTLANSIGTQTLSGDLGSFTMNSGNLILKGAQIKTYKNSGSNVCQPILYYLIFPTGARPANPTFNALNLNWISDAINGDQTWGNIALNVDLTTMTAGNYTIEVYYSIPGNEQNQTTCSVLKYDSNNSNNYYATFAISNALPVVFGDFQAIVKDDRLNLKWTTESEHDCDYFEILASKDGSHFTTIGKVDSKSNQGNSSTPLQYIFNTPISAGASFAAITFLGLLILSVGKIGNKTRLAIFSFILLYWAIFFARCNKPDTIINIKAEKLFVKIKQIDKNGKWEESKIMRVIFE